MSRIPVDRNSDVFIKFVGHIITREFSDQIGSVSLTSCKLCIVRRHAKMTHIVSTHTILNTNAETTSHGCRLHAQSLSQIEINKAKPENPMPFAGF